MTAKNSGKTAPGNSIVSNKSGDVCVPDEERRQGIAMYTINKEAKLLRDEREWLKGALFEHGYEKQVPQRLEDLCFDFVGEYGDEYSSLQEFEEAYSIENMASVEIECLNEDNIHLLEELHEENSCYLFIVDFFYGMIQEDRIEELKERDPGLLSDLQDEKKLREDIEKHIKKCRSDRDKTHEYLHDALKGKITCTVSKKR